MWSFQKKNFIPSLLPIDISETARIYLYNTNEFESWPLGPENDRMTGMLMIDTNPAKRREANEIV